MFKFLVHKFQVLLRWIAIWIGNIVSFFTHDMWFVKHDEQPKWKSRLLRDAKIVYLMMDTIADQKIGFQITALAYQSMMSVVPFLAIAFYLTAGVGLSDQLEEFLYANVNNERLINALMNAANNILTTAESGLFGFISMLTFAWILIWLMLSVRRVFNNVWKVEKEQKFLKSFGIGFGVLLLSPFVILLFFSGTVFYSHVLGLIFPDNLFLSNEFRSFLSWAMFTLVAILMLSLMFKYIPGTKVQYRHALKGAIIAGITFALVQYLYLETQILVAKLSAVYGVLAALPLFMLWLNLGWTIILYGAELTYAFQNWQEYEKNIQQLDQEIDQDRELFRRPFKRKE